MMRLKMDEVLLPVLGIDVSKAKLHVALLQDPRRRPKRKVVSNDVAGYEALSQWLHQQGVSQVHGCLEATNTYGTGVATYLHEQGQRVSVINPLRMSGFAQSELQRSKTDSADAALIAQFGWEKRPPAWLPPPPELVQLQALTRRLEALNEMINQERNRLDTSHLTLHPEINAHIKFLQDQVQALKTSIQAHVTAHPTLAAEVARLDSIVGIGSVSAACIRAEIGEFQRFDSARQLAAYSGLTPQHHQSGTSVHGKVGLSKIGNAHLRYHLYFPALVAIRRSPEIAQWREHLLKRGKTKMQVVGAVMHKLLRVCFGVLRSGQDFNAKMIEPKSLTT
jgi:transposase